MKTKNIIVLAAVAILVTGCHHINSQFEKLIAYPTTAEEVAERADHYKSDAALVVTKADTQYVLYHRKGDESCFAMRYVSEHRCKHDFTSRGGEFRLGVPEQVLTVNRTADNALTLTVDSVVIAVSDIVGTDSTVTFRLGFDTSDREAVLYLYRNARGSDALAETSIQQMIVLALSMDALFEESDAEVEAGLAEADSSLAAFESEMEQTERELDQAGEELERAAASKAYGNYYAEYSRLDSLASALGFVSKESRADNDHMYFKVWGGRGGSKKCYARMERMSEAAGTCHTAGYSVHHNPHHRGCTFTVRW